MFIETIIDHRTYFGSPGASKTKSHIERRSSDLNAALKMEKKLVPNLHLQFKTLIKITMIRLIKKISKDAFYICNIF